MEIYNRQSEDLVESFINFGAYTSSGAKDDWDFRISDLVKNPGGIDI